MNNLPSAVERGVGTRVAEGITLSFIVTQSLGGRGFQRIRCPRLGPECAPQAPPLLGGAQGAQYE